MSAVAGVLAAGWPAIRSVAEKPILRPHEPFSFLFITDAHLQPDLNAAAGCHACFNKAHAIVGDFVIQGGDHIFDALSVGRARANSLISLYAPPLNPPPRDHKNIVLNAYEVIALLASHNLLDVLQGHTHINEMVS